MLRAIGLFFLLLFAYWFDRHHLHFVDTLFGQISLNKILLYLSDFLKELASTLN